MTTINFANAKAFGITQSDLKYIKERESNEWFKDTYGQIGLYIRLIISEINNNCEKLKNNQLKFSEYNNVIAISGDRGTGKSSVMYTILKCLESDPISQDRLNLDELSNEALQKGLLSSGHGKLVTQPQQIKSLSDCSFLVLPPIDPSKFPKRETLVGHVVANIYKQIINTIENNPDIEIARFDHFLEQCDKILEALRIYTLGVEKSMGDNPDDLDMLGKLANTSELRRCLIELIEEFLALKCPSPSHQCDGRDKRYSRHLVIAIDDLDTNIDTGYSLSEEIRNFLFIPQVVILMAIKIEQLSDVVQQHYLSAFSQMHKSNGVLDAEPDEMATKYIQKLIPDQRRIYLPSVLSQSMTTINIISAKNPNKIRNLIDYFFLLIWRKSGILLVKNSRESHGLLPVNLRGVHQIINLLESMPDIVIDNNNQCENLNKNLHGNLQRLETWLVDSVSSNAIPRDLAVTFRKMSGHPNTGFNGFVVRLLREYISSSENSFLFGNDDTAKALVDVTTNPQSISLGDVLYLLDKIEQYNSSAGYVHYTAAIRMLFSLRMTALFFPISSKEGCSCPDYNSVMEMLGGLIYNPEIKLTLTGREWMFNRNSTLASLKGVEGAIDLKKEVVDLDSFSAKKNIPRSGLSKAGENVTVMSLLSLKDAVWLSFFAVQYGERLRKGRPSSHREGSCVRSRFAPESDAFFGFVSFNWLAFVHNCLQPQITIERLLGYSFPVKELFELGEICKLNKYFSENDIKDAKDFLGKFFTWQEKYLSPLPLHCIDVISGLIQSLGRNRWRPNVDNEDNIGKLNEFFHLRQRIEEDFIALLEKTAIRDEVVHSQNENICKKKLVNAFSSCPILSENDIFDVYRLNQDVQRKFDWFLTV